MRWLVAATAFFIWFFGFAVIPTYTNSQIAIYGVQTLGVFLIIINTQIGKPFSKITLLLTVLFCTILFLFFVLRTFWLFVPLAMLVAAFWWAERHFEEKVPTR